MSTTQSGSPTVGLGRFIKESRFYVPSHQRDYSWEEAYVKEFLEDIEDALSSNRESYFCGLMVFTPVSSATFKVLDGQQRLATTLMLFSAVRNWLDGFSEYTELRYQVNAYLSTKELGSHVSEPRLSLTAANNDAFQRYVIGKAPLNEITRALAAGAADDRSRVLLKSAIYVNLYVEERAEKFDSSAAAMEYFLRMLQYLSDHVQIVRFVLSTDSAAYTIFETLNDRGLELAPLDLVKNYLFSRAEKYRKGSLPEFEARWGEMMALVSSAKADSFLRTFWSARHGKPEGADLFKSFKDEYKEPHDLYNISVEMRRDAETYAALSSSSDPIWIGYSARARQSVDALSIIGFSQAYPVLLAALNKFSKREMERLLWLVECVAVRHQLIGRRRPGRVESLGGRAAREITQGNITTASDVLSHMRELYVPNDVFRLAFESHKENNGRKIRYLLSGIERQSIVRQGSTLTDELTPVNVTVEHIFPKSPTVEWLRAVEKDKLWENVFVSRLGNLCLLPSINQALGNKSWSEKVSVYNKSRLVTTRKLTEYDQWGRTEIEARQKYMAQLAVSAWHFQ